MANNNVKLTIIIVNWNTADLLYNCLESLYENPPLSTFEVIVVDNASTDGSVEMVRNEFPQVTVLANNENVGFARANNLAIQQINSEYCLLLNSDTLVLPNSLEQMLSFIESNSDIGVLGANLLNKNLWPIASYGYFPRIVSVSIELTELYYNVPWLRSLLRPLGMAVSGDDPFEAEYVSGACFLAPTKLLQEHGGLSQDFFVYFEETDFCYRIRKRDWRIMVLPTAKIIHLDGGSFDGEINIRKKLLLQGLFIYFRRNRGLIATLILKIMLIGLYSVLKLSWVFKDRANPSPSYKMKVEDYKDIIYQITSEPLSLH